MVYIKDEIDRRVTYHNGELPFHHPTRIAQDAEECIENVEMWLTVGYSLALHAQHMLSVLEEHGLTHILEKHTSVKHLFNDEVRKGRNAEQIQKERHNGNGSLNGSKS